VRVLAFRHVPFEDVGHIRPVLEARGIEVTAVDLYRGDAGLPDPSVFDGLIFMGGPMSANDDLPYLKQELAMLRDALGRGQPVLGVCLGSQLLARALGARVYRNPVKEIGWYDIELTAPAAADPLFAGLPPRQTVFQWHGETFHLAPGAELLATSPACRHQAFRFGRAAYGLQFHAEVTPAMIADWCGQEANCGDLREVAHSIDPNAHERAMCDLSAHLFGRWACLL
jgi:GMP synthase-like glutamine amidotransferase